MKCITSLFILSFVFNISLSQALNEGVLKKILQKNAPQFIADNEQQMLRLYKGTNEEEKKKMLSIIDQFTNSSDLHLSARSLTWKAVILARPPFNKPEESYSPMQQSVAKAVQTGDHYLMVEVFESYGAHYSTFGNPEIALFYYLKSAEIRKELNDENLSIKNNQHFITVGDLLFKMEEYDKAIEYL